ncbi:MAG: hypothetical protein ACYCWE_20930 [Eubacteriales bacterium]
MSILQVRDALKTVLPNDTHHLRAPTGLVKYIVWAEAMESEAQWSDNTMQYQSIIGNADYFTDIEFDGNVDKIQKALSDADIEFKLTGIEYIDETKRLNYTWQWTVLCELGDMYG